MLFITAYLNTTVQEFLEAFGVLKFKDAKSRHITPDASVVVDNFIAEIMSHIKIEYVPAAGKGTSGIRSSYGSTITALKGAQIKSPDEKVN